MSPTRQPTRSPTSEPTIRPSTRPTATPSQNPTSLSSESPTIVAPSHNPSANPSAIASDSPTLSPVPSPSPSSAPSALASNGPSASTIPSQGPTTSPSTAPSTKPSATPSITPSMAPSGSPSIGPSFSPSAIDSDQPTLSLSPSLAPSALPSMVVSGNPSDSVSPTAAPTVTRSEGPSSIPSMAPSLIPSSDPSIGPSTTPPFETAVPTIRRDAQRLPIFTIEYQLFDFEDPTETDLVELEALTRAYLRDHMFGAIDDADALLDDFFTTYTDDQTDSGALVINVSFESTAFYNPSSPTIIPVDDLTEEVVNAFTGEELDEYIERVQSLPNSNTFAGSIQVFLISQLESRSQRSLISILLSGSAAVVSILGGFGFIRYHRRKSARRQASKQFLEMVSKDSRTVCSSIQGDFKDLKTDSSVLSLQGDNSNPFENSNDVWERSEADDFLHEKRSAYSRPRMHKFSDD
ncbi:unnamed protein product [Cylindrotheca closterium]|uniref:Circumsporozoite protein n=1 Tax=Cylindrotheca closterium TaxID=2856 RepID=A0AAD2JLV1_9STRA|nr:unnamed protein product [Cylindrotheca closterium]